jgi:hypothetical protein
VSQRNPASLVSGFLFPRVPCQVPVADYAARMLLRFLGMFVGLAVVSGFAAEPAPWKLVWADEFDGAKLDLTKWAAEENAHGGGNSELQFFVERRTPAWRTAT